MVSEPIEPSAETLRAVTLLSVLSEQECASLLSLGQEYQFEPYANIIIEGELSWGFYLILQGTVGIYKTNKISGSTYDVGQLRQGSFFGEMSMIDDNPRSATVRALTPCTLFYISKESFMTFLSESHDRKLRFMESCVRLIINRLRELDDNYVVSQYQLWKTALLKEAA